MSSTSSFLHVNDLGTQSPGNLTSPILSESTQETERVGEWLGRYYVEKSGSLPPFICLDGDLGCGKTALVRGFARAFDPGIRVRSPSFSIVNVYSVKNASVDARPIFHFDMYRVTSYDDLYSTGYDEYPDSGICLVEWSCNVRDALPSERVEIVIAKIAGQYDSRSISVTVRHSSREDTQVC